MNLESNGAVKLLKKLVRLWKRSSLFDEEPQCEELWHWSYSTEDLTPTKETLILIKVIAIVQGFKVVHELYSIGVLRESQDFGALRHFTWKSLKQRRGCGCLRLEETVPS